jgi:hypothetical protein
MRAILARLPQRLHAERTFEGYFLRAHRISWHRWRVLWPRNGDRRLARFLVASFALSGCGLFEEGAVTNETARFPITVTVYGDARQPLTGVEILEEKRVLGKTDAAGQVHLKLQGNEGSSASLTVKCPATFKSPEQPIVVGLRQMSANSPAPRFEAACIPLVRTVVVGLRAENGADLNIIRLNQVIGRTDPNGVAHVLLQASPGEQVVLTLNTASNPNLRPQSPTLTFIAGDRNEMVLLEQKFTVVKPVVRARPKNIPRPL